MSLVYQVIMSELFEKNFRIFLPRQEIILDRFRENTNPYLALWKDFFNNFKNYKVDVDQVCIKCISEIEVTDLSLLSFYKQLSSDDEGTLPRCWIDIKIKRKTEVIEYPDSESSYKFVSSQLDVIKRIPRFTLQAFLEDLFLAFNLCVPGSLHLTNVEVREENNSKKIELNLFGDRFELVWDKAHKDEWPFLQILEFSQTWQWMGKVNYKGTPVARKPIHKALLTLLQLTKGAGLKGQDGIILLSQTLEGLLVESFSGIRKTLEDRINIVLGKPNTHKKWLSKFYRIRSKIVHGTEPIYRENANEFDSSLEEELFLQEATLDRATAVLIALIQTLIKNDGQKFIFEEVLEIKKCT